MVKPINSIHWAAASLLAFFSGVDESVTRDIIDN